MSKLFPGVTPHDRKSGLPYIFLSYKSEEWEIAAEYALYLRKGGINVYYDGVLEPGEKWEEKLLESIEDENCKGVVMMVSARSLASPHLKNEASVANHRGKPILGVYIENVVARTQPMKTYLNNIQSVSEWQIGRSSALRETLEGANKIITESFAPAQVKTTADELFANATVFVKNFARNHKPSDRQSAQSFFSQMTINYPADYRGWMGLAECACITVPDSTDAAVALLEDAEDKYSYVISAGCESLTVAAYTEKKAALWAALLRLGHDRLKDCATSGQVNALQAEMNGWRVHKENTGENGEAEYQRLLSDAAAKLSRLRDEEARAAAERAARDKAAREKAERERVLREQTELLERARVRLDACVTSAHVAALIPELNGYGSRLSGAQPSIGSSYQRLLTSAAQKLNSLREKETIAAAERAAQEKAAAERAEAEKAEAERIAREKAAAEKAEAERIAREKAEAERIAREKAEAERIAKEKAERKEAERQAREKKRQERAAAWEKKRQERAAAREKTNQEQAAARERAKQKRAERAAISKIKREFKFKIFNDETAEIDKYVGSCRNVIIPAVIDGCRVTRIGDYAFENCNILISVVIPNSVTTIGYSAFSNCHNLAKIAIPNSVTTIGDSAFLNCHNLANIAIPNSVTTIGSNAFFGCNSLHIIKIPYSASAFSAFPYWVRVERGKPDC